MISAVTAGQYVDLLITESDLTIIDGLIHQIEGRASITQDIKHMMLESGLLTKLVGQRDRETRQSYLVQLVQLAEDDKRMIPGTAKFTELNSEQYWFTAKTVDYHDIGFWL